MKTLERFKSGLDAVPLYTSSLLEDLGRMQGRQDLYTRQSPERLNRLKESAIVESAIASNRIEGVEIDRGRIDAVLRSRRHLRDRDEEEVRNYQDALKVIHDREVPDRVDGPWMLRLHEITKKGAWDAGRLKEKDGEIIEKLPGGGEVIRFRPTPAKETPNAVKRMSELVSDLTDDSKIPSLLLLAAHNLDFLCIHPFRDGNGRVSRLLLLDTLYRCGYEVGRYVSLEGFIEKSKERYYETLRISSEQWHEGKHDFWPYINYLLYTVKEAYSLFEERLGQSEAPYGEKTQLVIEAIDKQDGSFRVSEIADACPGVSTVMIRKVLADLQASGEAECLGKGRYAQWVKKKRSPDDV